MKSKIIDDYYNWLIGLTCGWCHGNYTRLMSYLDCRQFTWTISNDENRASDGVDMRFRFVEETPEYNYRDVYLYLTQSCSVLEMMAALAIRCEDHIMGDPSTDNHTDIWFWEMIANMHLDQMTDDNFDESYVEQIVTNMLERRYKKNGEGGLFRIKDNKRDMRTVEIWCQLSWYLNEIT